MGGGSTSHNQHTLNKGSQFNAGSEGLIATNMTELYQGMDHGKEDYKRRLALSKLLAAITSLAGPPLSALQPVTTFFAAADNQTHRFGYC
ncbi:hypothetical protein HAX54_032678 [Datura stramonium]|uniref:Uncharacterized protein n=1 Tax=Datura stramonium TaxID=4076 RepID=A0ABS8VEU4_DATST|nr:hypothetical protein [Datura stramonium]